MSDNRTNRLLEDLRLLLRLLPLVMDEKVFAVHGGSGINLSPCLLRNRQIWDEKNLQPNPLRAVAGDWGIYNSIKNLSL